MCVDGFIEESPIYPFITRHYAHYCNRDTFCRENPELTYFYHEMVPGGLRTMARLRLVYHADTDHWNETPAPQ